MNALKRMRFLIASGPTQEPLDPVRFLSNRSTGAMGRYLALSAKRRGHRVTWVRCPEDARTARDLEKKLIGLLPKNDVLIMSAAVCDVRPALVSRTKLGKHSIGTVRFVRNPDILAGLGRKKKKGQVFIGFGLESEALKTRGLRKLKAKNLEAIVLQKVTERRSPFGDKRVDALILKKNGPAAAYRHITKQRLSAVLVREAEKLTELSA